MNRAPHPFSLRQLQYAVAVADTRNFRKAAELCRVAQPSLSAQLAQLEAALGVRLFERGRGGVHLTTPGEDVVNRARRILTEADDFVEGAKRVADPLAGRLRLGVIPTVSPYLLPEVAQPLSRGLPKVALLWTEDKTDVLVAQVAAGELDGAIVALEARLGEWEHEVLGRDPFVLVAAPRNPLMAHKGLLALEDLRNAQVLLLDEGHCLRDQALAVCGEAHAQEADFRATSLVTLVQMVAASDSVTLLPTLAVPTETRRSDVAVRAFAGPVPSRTLALVWRRGGARALALHKVAEIVRAAVWPSSTPSLAPAKTVKSASNKIQRRRAGRDR
jgi:LysR family hydrogen peroxide-inducible transcriptional activator